MSEKFFNFITVNVSLYTEKETAPQGQNRAACFVTTAHFLHLYIYIYIYIYRYIYIFITHKNV